MRRVVRRWPTVPGMGARFAWPREEWSGTRASGRDVHSSDSAMMAKWVRRLPKQISTPELLLPNKLLAS